LRKIIELSNKGSNGSSASFTSQTRHADLAACWAPVAAAGQNDEASTSYDCQGLRGIILRSAGKYYLNKMY
jgi:hypothetical protein